MPSTIHTLKHKLRVAELLNDAAIELLQRAKVHDDSKLIGVEKELLDQLQVRLDAHGYPKYGTPEYDENTKLLKPMLDSHYAKNTHHPEHYTNGVNGMDLFDVIEMFFDWKAASERNKDTNMNLLVACRTKKVDEQLTDIFVNTARRLGYSL